MFRAEEAARGYKGPQMSQEVRSGSKATVARADEPGKGADWQASV